MHAWQNHEMEVETILSSSILTLRTGVNFQRRRKKFSRIEPNFTKNGKQNQLRVSTPPAIRIVASMSLVTTASALSLKKNQKGFFQSTKIPGYNFRLSMCAPMQGNSSSFPLKITVILPNSTCNNASQINYFLKPSSVLLLGSWKLSCL